MTSLFCKPWVLTAVLLAVCVQARAETAAVLPASVQEALKAARLPPDALSVVVLPVQAGNPRLQHQAGVQRNPASLMKLVTTSAALDMLGTAFTWRTPCTWTVKCEMVCCKEIFTCKAAVTRVSVWSNCGCCCAECKALV